MTLSITEYLRLTKGLHEQAQEAAMDRFWVGFRIITSTHVPEGTVIAYAEREELNEETGEWETKISAAAITGIGQPVAPSE